MMFVVVLASLTCCAVGAPLPWWQESSLANAKSMALTMDREAKRYFSYSEGHIAESEKVLQMYFEYSRNPLVKTIYETGFNGGHSSAIFLTANPTARVISFDIGQHPYTQGNAGVLRGLYGERFQVVWGDSRNSIPYMQRMMPQLRCDLFSVDGSHSFEGALGDLLNFHRMASCRNWILMDDAGWRSVNRAWQTAKDLGIVTQLECFADTHGALNYPFIDTPDNRTAFDNGARQLKELEQQIIRAAQIGGGGGGWAGKNATACSGQQNGTACSQQTQQTAEGERDTARGGLPPSYDATCRWFAERPVSTRTLVRPV
ncbi:unnamed protein product [Vitrella brassicaformis CCMP3155]|uniref:Methyltransferase domain-containing protein n=1 Tax=Vitrella brassicaformis (strain CCMP3155) TaxID=1169540 RepID=A0A0G4ES08_VITBC|nr:unnamed protein product [Vitrella brassicaformis CCMP3155]|eukprot:CEM00687.1 unnamed protein product [Vitrella brassicaformis CCMP3155]